MCYDIKTNLETLLKRARKKGDETNINELREVLGPYKKFELFHATAFSHPSLLIYTNQDPYKPVRSVWGLVPYWAKNEKQKNELWDRTVNAKGETIFEKPSFRDSAKHKRCLIYLDGFYEHHHYNGKVYPFYIQHKDKLPLSVAGLWSEWTNKETGEIINTFSIVTTKANKLMSKIHNNPKLNEPRMPVIIPLELEDQWLKPVNTENDKKMLQELLIPFPGEELTAHTVRRLKGKEAVGNIPKASEEFVYEELQFNN